ncbi:MAG: RNase adapter RapZ [Burkholderiales bacterium]|nr:RNase adapter RapZ [Burkholderiales bacterium]
MRLILVTGLSGSGKSVALNVLEDAGYYCVDNLPAPLLPELVATLREAGREHVAVAVDARTASLTDTVRKGVTDLPQYLANLSFYGIDVRVLFLDAKTDTLIKRFSETRRRHPLDDGTATIPEYIERERELLGELQSLGHHVDTSDLRPNTLRDWLKDFLRPARSDLTLVFTSFGFKHGIPLDADLVFDVRALPNPHYDPALRPLTGRDAAVIAFLDATPAAQELLEDIDAFVAKWLPTFARDNRHYLTVAIGCTGGRHRSVYFAENLAARFLRRGTGSIGAEVLVRHREVRAD